MGYSTPGSSVLHYLPEFVQIHITKLMILIISSSAAPFSSCLQSFPASRSFPISQLSTSGGQSFSISISPSGEYSELISFRIEWSDLLAVQGTLKSLSQHPNSKASVLRRSAFFMVQLSHPYYWKNHGFDYAGFCQQSDVSAF